MHILTMIERDDDLVILLEDEQGQYVYSQRNDDADQWSVFQEVPRESPKKEEIIFTVNQFLEGIND